MNREECAAFGKECLICHKKNHFAKVCERRDSRSNYVRMDGDTTASEASSDEESDETDYCSADEVVTHHFAVNSSDFRRGHQRGQAG
jgi:hypothetical protein